MEPPPDDRPENNPLMHPPGTAEWERQNKEHGKWSKPTLVFAFVLFGVFVVAGLSVTVESARESAMKGACGCHGQIALAITRYAEEHGEFPPAHIKDAYGRPMHSWRALILPYLESSLAAEYKFDEPWNGPNNSKLHQQMPSVFHCDADRAAIEGETSYVAVVGDETMWPRAGSRKLEDVSDGADCTILIVEAKGLNIPWLEPRDLDFEQMSFQINDPKQPSISSGHKSGASVWMTQWHWKFLENLTPPETVRAMLTVAGGEQISPPASGATKP